jgi:7,8-dihydropterin-6-yl-methyl-4-(beta-D-ribofuranosyl)aminobenzene 5'-phosphate synthase
MALTSGILIFAGKQRLMAQGKATTDTAPVRVHMIYNNTGSQPGLKGAWGLSVWVSTGEGNLLFDTGGDPDILRDNMHHLGLDPSSLISVILSHDHWDHRNGLSWLLEKADFVPELFVPVEVRGKYALTYPAARIRGITGPEEILTGIWSTGSMATTYKGDPLYEQALVILRGDRLWLLNGCSHPGVIPMVSQVKKTFPGKRIALVSGGFHLGSKTGNEVREISDFLRQEGVEKIAPSHCTGEEAIPLFRKEWGSDFTEFNLGDELTLF